MVDVAFCESFRATSMEVDFSNYPPPFAGPKYTIALQQLSGEEVEFGNGVPVSVSAAGWKLSSASTMTPDNWERVDFTFYSVSGEYAGSAVLFSQDVHGTEWAWTSGYNVNSPRCTLKLT